MQTDKEDKMSKEEIIKYVDDLIKANKRYDKRLSPLLYDFFLRANEKFEWPREEFLEKYQNFKNNVKRIKIVDMKKVGMPSLWMGGFRDSNNDKAIYINEKVIENVKNAPTNEGINAGIVDNLFHECLHATDLKRSDGKLVRNGLYKVTNFDTNQKDTMLNEYANVLSASLISSDKTMYTDDLGIDFINNGSYSTLKCPGEILCATFDITEPQLAKLKDKGEDFFYKYLKNKFPYADIENTLDVFKSSLNIIFNASNNNDKENISLGFKNMMDAANNVISCRLENVLNCSKDKKETLDRIYYDMFKIRTIVKSVDRIYGLEENNKVDDWEALVTYVEFEEKAEAYNKQLFTQEEKTKKGENAQELIESKFGHDYKHLKFDIEEIVRKYYPQSKEPLNDNTKLIEKVKEITLKPTIKEKIKNFINKVKNIKTISSIKELPLPEEFEQQELKGTEEHKLEENEENIDFRQKSANFRNSIKYENTIMHNINTKTKGEQYISKENKESTR